MPKCPNLNCDGSSRVLYPARSSNDYEKINFNCTTDTYFKPQLSICKKCQLIFSDLVFDFNDNNLEQKYS